MKSGWNVVLSIFKEVIKTENEESIQKQILKVLFNIGKNNYNAIKDIFKDFISCLMAYEPQHQEEVMEIVENFVEQVEEEKNYKTLLDFYFR